MTFFKSIRYPIFAYRTLQIPIRTANRHGPARSPTVLETCSADSVNADAHCDIDSSEAPEQTIRRTRIRKCPSFNSCQIDMLSPFSTGVLIGQVANNQMFTSGITAQKQERTGQFRMPNTVKKIVERRMTATDPQQ